MKKLNLLAVLFLSVFISSCGSDDESSDDSTENILNIENNNYSLLSGGLDYYGTWGDDNIHNFDLSLVSTEVNQVEGGFVPEENVYSAVHLELWIENASDIEVGTYLYNNTEASFTFSSGAVVENYNYTNNTGSAYAITEGVLEVLQVGDIYEFSFEGSTYDNKTVSFYYKGDLYLSDINERVAAPNGRSRSTKRFFLSRN